MPARNRRSSTPTLQTLEGRELLTSTVWASSSPVLGGADVTRIASALGRVTSVSPTAAASGATSPGGGFPAPAQASPSPLLGQGDPTPAERARERFDARFAGPLRTLPPRFTDQSKILYLRGLGTSNFFLHGDYDLAIVLPKDPTATITGFAFLDDKNSNAGANFGLDLVADPTSIDAKGRPTRLTFTSDPNIYGGTFFVTQSTGTVTIVYGQNSAKATFQGRLYTSGLTSAFQNTDLYVKGRP